MEFAQNFPECEIESKSEIVSFISNFETLFEPREKIKKEEVKSEALNFAEIISKIGEKFKSSRLLPKDAKIEGLSIKKIVDICEKSLKELSALKTNLEDEINKHQRYCKDAERRR